MEDLKTLSSQKFERQLEQHWISDTLADCIREVYSTSNDMKTAATRRALVKTVSSHRSDLIPKRQFQELIREGGDFAADIITIMAAGTSKW